MVLFHWWNFVLSTEFRGRIRAFLTIDAHHHSLPWAGPLLVQIVDQRPRWPVQTPPPLATANWARQGRMDYADSRLMARRLAASLSR